MTEIGKVFEKTFGDKGVDKLLTTASSFQCPKCGGGDVYKPDNRNGSLRCRSCRHQNNAIKFIPLKN